MDQDQDLVNRIFFDIMYNTFNPEEREAIEYIISALS